MVASTRKTTTANNHELQFSAASDGTDRSAVRRVAAAIPRDAGVDRITKSVLHDATVWVDTDGGGASIHLDRLDGVDVVDVFLAESGSVAVDVEL